MKFNTKKRLVANFRTLYLINLQYKLAHLFCHNKLKITDDVSRPIKHIFRKFENSPCGGNITPYMPLFFNGFSVNIFQFSLAIFK